jgi:hypothetical protein
VFAIIDKFLEKKRKLFLRYFIGGHLIIPELGAMAGTGINIRAIE